MTARIRVDDGINTQTKRRRLQREHTEPIVYLRPAEEPSQQSRTQQMKEWFKKVGIWWDEQSLRISEGGKDGIGVFTRKPIRAQQVIGRVPKSAVLSVHNGTLSHHLLPCTAKGAQQGGRRAHVLRQGVGRQHTGGYVEEELEEEEADDTEEEEELLRPDSALAITVLFEKLLGRLSKWHGYLASLQSNEPVPYLWSNEEADLLQGTELDGAPYEDM